SPSAHRTSADIDLDVAKALDHRHRGRGGRSAPMSRAANQRLDPRQELEDSERFRDVVVRAETEAEYFVRLLASRREDEHGNGPTFVAQGSQDPIAIHAGQHEIEHDEIGIDL